jgi:hypothetical protein
MKWAAIVGLVVLAGCWDSKPKHYFVLCESKDRNGWALIDAVKKDGYLISCTYQSPDKRGIYTSRCDNDGCGIK